LGLAKPHDLRRKAMPIDTLLVYVGMYRDLYAAEADGERVKDLQLPARDARRV
jgi:hypothetical protein